MFDSHALFEHDHEDEGHGHDNKKHHKLEYNGSLNNNRITDELPEEDQNNYLLEGGADKIPPHHHHHGYATTADPAAAVMIENIKQTVEKIHQQHDKEEPDNTFDREIIEEEEAKAEQEIRENIKSYLSRTDQFAFRMSKIMHQAG
jgi:hypothetical protein